MQRVDLGVQERVECGTGPAHRLRAKDRIPAVLYGIDVKAKLLSLSRKDLERIIGQGAYENILVALHVEGQSEELLSLIKELQFDPATDRVLHADFLHVSMDRPITTEIPVRLIGVAAGAKMGGVLEHVTRAVLVQCLPLDMPDLIEVDISPLNIGDSLHVRNLQVSENVKILTDASRAVVVLATPTIEIAPTVAVPAEGEVAAEGAAEGEKKGEEKAGEAE